MLSASQPVFPAVRLSWPGWPSVALAFLLQTLLPFVSKMLKEICYFHFWGKRHQFTASGGFCCFQMNLLDKLLRFSKGLCGWVI